MTCFFLLKVTNCLNLTVDCRSSSSNKFYSSDTETGIVSQLFFLMILNSGCGEMGNQGNPEAIS